MTTLEQFARNCRLWNDEYLLEEFHKGPAGYAHGGHFEIISSEVARRGLASEPPPIRREAVPATPSGPYLTRLWRGEVPLAETYWVWGVALGLLLFLLFRLTYGTLLVIGLLLLLLTFGHVVLISVAIWRSAGRYTGPKIWGVLARVVVVLRILRALLFLVQSL